MPWGYTESPVFLSRISRSEVAFPQILPLCSMWATFPTLLWQKHSWRLASIFSENLQKGDMRCQKAQVCKPKIRCSGQLTTEHGCYWIHTKLRSLTFLHPKAKSQLRGSQDGQGSVKTGPRFFCHGPVLYSLLKADQTKPSIWTKETQEASALIEGCLPHPHTSVTLVLNYPFPSVPEREGSSCGTDSAVCTNQPEHTGGVTAGD